MRITHLCLGCFFPDGYSYQENLLPKYHKELGHEVSVIASLQTFDKNGKVSYLEKPSKYVNENKLPVIRLAYKSPEKLYKKVKRFAGTYEAIQETKPDVLFIHGCQFLDIDIVVKYLEVHKNVTVYVDNHADFSNSATNWASLHILHKIIWKRCAHMILPYTRKFYGVLPARVDFLKDVYGLPADRIELLIMGADDDKVKEVLDVSLRSRLRHQYGIKDGDFLIVTGGKIDKAKQQTILLMQAVKQLAQENSRIKLLVFGSVIPEMKETVEANQSENVQYIGWVNSDKTYQYFGMADLACFPGRHSVFWEQVAGMGIPLLVKYWDGTTHVDMGGNAEFLREDSVGEMMEKITNIRKCYAHMKEAAECHAQEFLYSRIAEKSLQ